MADEKDEIIRPAPELEAFPEDVELLEAARPNREDLVERTGEIKREAAGVVKDFTNRGDILEDAMDVPQPRALLQPFTEAAQGHEQALGATLELLTEVEDTEERSARIELAMERARGIHDRLKTKVREAGALIHNNVASDIRELLKKLESSRRKLEDAEAMGEDTTAIEARLREFVEKAEELESEVDYALYGQETERFTNRSPVELQQDLRAGAEHPRWKEALANYRMARQNPSMTRAELMGVFAPEPLVKASATIEGAGSGDAISRALAQIENRFYGEAARSIETLLADPAIDADTRKALSAAQETLRMAEQEKKEQYERMGELQEQLYTDILAELEGDDSPEANARREFIENRRRTERVLRGGKLVGGLRPMAEVLEMPDGKKQMVNFGFFKPMRGTIELDGERVDAVVKLAQVDRSVRAGITPGHGALRAVAGGIRNIGLGADSMPGMGAQEHFTDDEGNEYGEALVMELLTDVASCDDPRRENWFKNRSADYWHSVEMNAIDDDLAYRTDGFVRNYLTNGKQYIIDVDLDAPAVIDPLRTPFASLPRQAMAEKPVSERAKKKVERFRGSTAEKIYKEAINNTQHNMSGFLARHDLVLNTYMTEKVHPDYTNSNDTSWNEDYEAFTQDELGNELAQAG